jgi:hypothetical protein
MAFDWHEFLLLARWLQAQGTSIGISGEAVARCAMGRAYYAAYGHAHRYRAGDGGQVRRIALAHHPFGRRCCGCLPADCRLLTAGCRLFSAGDVPSHS